MKHVWMLNHYAQAPGEVGGTRHYSLARFLPAHGWDASVLAASIEHNTGRDRLRAGEPFRIDVHSGARFLWVRTPQYRRNGGGRAWNMLIYTLQVLRPGVTAGLPRPSLVIGSSVHPLAALAGAVLARRHGVPFLFEVRDLWPETLIAMGRLRANGLPARLMRALEKWLYRRAVRTIVLLPHADRYITGFGIAREKVVWIPNGIDLADEPPPSPVPDRPGFTIMYFGAHGEANGLGNVVRAMAVLQERHAGVPVCLRLIGAGPSKPGLQRLAADLGLTNISFEDPVPKDQIPVKAAEADAFIFNLVDAPVFQFGISSNKLFDFMAAGRPIVFCCRSSNNPVADAGAGPTVMPDDPSALANAIAALAARPVVERARMGSAGRAYVEQHHDFRVLAGRLAALMDEVLVPTTRAPDKIEPRSVSSR
jgi:glycosyltransferase involved in cell wall biosynthesis